MGETLSYAGTPIISIVRPWSKLALTAFALGVLNLPINLTVWLFESHVFVPGLAFTAFCVSLFSSLSVGVIAVSHINGAQGRLRGVALAWWGLSLSIAWPVGFLLWECVRDGTLHF